MEDILPADQQFRGAVIYRALCLHCDSIQSFVRLRDPHVPAYGVCQRCHYTASVGEEDLR